MTPCGLAALPDASLVVGVCQQARLALWRIDPAGALHAIRAPANIADFAADPSGGLYLIDDLSRLIHLAPATYAPSVVASLTRLRGFNPDTYELVAGASDGSALVSDGGRVWDVSSTGTARSLGDVAGAALVGLSDGSVANAERGIGVLRAAPGAPAKQIWRNPQLYDYGLGAGSMGSIVAAARYFSDYADDPQLLYGLITGIATDGTRTPLAGQTPGLGNGDGQPAAALRSRLNVAAGPALLADGSLAFLDNNAVRILAPPDSARPLAAFTPAAYASSRSGQASYTTTLAGRAHMELSSGRTVLRRVDAAAMPGTNTVSFAPPAPGDYTLTLTVTAADGRVAAARAAVSTRTHLPLRRGRKLLADYVSQTEQGDAGLGGGEEVFRCRSVGPLRVDCKRRSFSYQAIAISPTPRYRTSHGRCDGVLSVRLRPDGLDMVRLPCR